MRLTRRWLSALLLALGLLPGVDRILLAHVHESAGPLIAAASQGENARSEGWLHCAACHARATLDALVVDAHPERHGAAPATPPRAGLPAFAAATRAASPPARGPPPAIV
jgi:hypothetical protein